MVVFATIPYTAIKYHAKCIQTEKQYLSDGYHIADITIDGYTSGSYAIDDEQLDAYISGKEKISVKNISSGDTEIIKTSTISSFSVKNEDHIKRKGDERSHKRKSHKVEFYVLKQKEFNEYRKEQEDAGQVVSIVRNTSLKSFKKKKDGQEDEYLTIGTKKFALKQESSKKASGYIHVGDNRFVRIEKKFWPVIILLLAAILIGVLIWYLSRPGEHKVGPIDIEAFNPIRNDAVTEDATQEYTTFLGYSTITTKKVLH